LVIMLQSLNIYSLVRFNRGIQSFYWRMIYRQSKKCKSIMHSIIGYTWKGQETMEPMVDLTVTFSPMILPTNLLSFISPNLYTDRVVSPTWCTTQCLVLAIMSRDLYWTRPFPRRSSGKL
jgi:hypothetical protein